MITETIRTIPRTVVTGYLRAVRLPVDLAERIADETDNETWPPSLLFEDFEAAVETMMGSLLRDETLTEQGRLRQAKVTKLREAAELETEASAKRQQAHRAQLNRKAQVADQRKRTVRSAREREQAIERQADADKRKVDAAAAKKKGATRAQQAKQEKAVEQRERAHRAEALDAESVALDITDDALRAEDRVVALDERIEANKQSRKTG